MATEWIECRLDEVLVLQRGFDLPIHERRAGPVPVVASTGIVGSHDEARVKAPGVVVGRSGSLGGGQYVTEDFWPLNTTLWVKDFRGNDERFCYYLVKSLDLGQFNAGSGVPTLNRNHIAGLRVSIPRTVHEQRRIAHILGTLDDKIELNRQMNQTLEEMARALFKSWFVDFDPVRAKADGRDPGLPHHLADLFPDRLVDSPLGPIPEGWGSAPLSELIEEVREVVRPSDAPDETYSHFSLPAFDQGRVPLREVGSSIRSQKWRVPPRSVLVSRLNPRIPRVWLVDGLADSEGVASTEFAVARPRGHIGRAFVYCLAASESFGEQLVGLASGTSGSHQRASRESFLRLAVIEPPSAVVEAFDRIAAPCLEQAVRLLEQSSSLRTVRDALLPRLLVGSPVHEQTQDELGPHWSESKG